MGARAAMLADRKPDRAAEPAGLVTSRVTTGAADDLDAFSDPGLLAAGLVNLILFDPVAERLGEQWQGRREAIYDLVERILARRLGEDGAFVRTSETEYLVASPHLGLFTAQTTCLRVQAEVLKFFLGAASPSDLRLRNVQGIEGTRIVALPVDPAAAKDGEVREAEAAEAAARLAAFQAEAQADPTMLSADRWSPFVGSGGRKVKVSCRLEPVFELKSNSRIGYRLHRRVIDVETDVPLSPREIGNLARADHLRIDMATISRGLARLQADEAEGGQALSLIIPVSYFTLSNPDGRKMITHAFARARQAVMTGVLCEVCDIEGVPTGALHAAVHLIRPWSLFVLGHLSDEAPRGNAGMREAGIQAISVTCPHAITGDAEFLGWLRDAIRGAQKAARTILVYGCTPRRMALAGMLGVTHASMAGPEVD